LVFIGIWANNPTMLAVAKAKLHLGLDPSDVRVLSVGAGSWARRVVEPTAKEKDLDLGLADWAPHLLEMVIDASGMTTDMEASFLLRENYTRLSPLIPPGVSLALDDPSTPVWKSNFERPPPSQRRCPRDRVGSIT